MIAGVGLMLAQLVPPTKAVPATSTSKEMYDFWCTPARMSSILCQHHDLIAKMGAAKVRPSRRPWPRSEHSAEHRIVSIVGMVGLVGMVFTVSTR